MTTRDGDRITLDIDGQVRSFVISEQAEIRRAGAVTAVNALAIGDRVTLTVIQDLAATVHTVTAVPVTATDAGDSGG